MAVFNGVSLIPSSFWLEPDATFSTDSCLTGCGCISQSHYFHRQFPEDILAAAMPIHSLEMLAILVGVRLWGAQWNGKKLVVYPDNFAVVDVINTSRTRVDFLASCLRELWFYVSSYCFELRAVHLPGVENRLADNLSRWHLSPIYASKFLAKIDNQDYTVTGVSDDMFILSTDV
jgi:hypothetical protein